MTSGSEASAAGIDVAAPAGPLPERALSSVRSWDRALLASVAVAIGIGALLVAAVAHDPAFGVTTSSSPFSDEGFNVVNARNLVLLGRWSTDGWNLHLVNLPFSLTMAGVFGLFGVGIVQARLATIAMLVATVAVLSLVLRRPFGRWPATIAAVAYGTSTLVLYYGRLVYLEDLVALGMVVGVATLGLADARPTAAGLIAGLAFGTAIGTKPSAVFGVLGLFVAVALVDGLRSSSTRRWLAAAMATIAALGATWALAIWLPHQAEVAVDLRIWATVRWPASVADALRRVADYVLRRDDDGAIKAAAPLIALAAVGLLSLIAWGWRLRPDQRRLAAAAVGWFAAGMLVLLFASYRPNRYVVPLLPSLAILGAAGLSLFGAAVASRLPPRVAAPAIAALGLLVAIAAAAPGVAAHLAWVSATGSTLPASQALLEGLVPAGAVTVGSDAPTLLMSAPVTTIEPRAGIPGNSGDLYTTAGARWFMTGRAGNLAIVTMPPGVWESRRLVACVPWFRTHACLFEVP